MFSKSKGDSLNRSLRRVSEFEGRGKIKDAITELEKAIKLRPNDGNLFNRLGDLYIKISDTKNAIKAFTKGVDAYRKDNFARNAIALCKKILRYDPTNIEIVQIIAELLIELDEKSDALIYYFSYAEKQAAQNNTDAVIKALNCIEGLGNLDGKAIKKIHEIYKSIGKDELAKKFLDQVMKEDVTLEEICIPETPAPVKEEKSKPVVESKKAQVSAKTVEIDEPKKTSSTETEQLAHMMKEVEAAIAQLRKAMRLDEVIIALDKSMMALSGEQKKAVALLQTSLSRNLDSLHKAIKDLNESSTSSVKDLDAMLNNLSKALASLSKNQALFTERTNDSLDKLGDRFESTAKGSIVEIKRGLADYKKTTEDVCNMLDDCKNCDISLLKVTEEMKLTVSKMSDSLIKFIIQQDVKSKEQKLYATIVIIIIALICGLTLFSIFK